MNSPLPLPYVDALVLSCSDLEAARRFYVAIGLPLEGEAHGRGPLHYACELGPVHFALCGAEGPGAAAPRSQAGGSLAGFQVASVEATFAATLEAGGVEVQAPADYPWGRRALVRDPDGRVVELNARA